MMKFKSNKSKSLFKILLIVTIYHIIRKKFKNLTKKLMMNI